MMTGVYSCQLAPFLPFTSFVSLNLWSVNLNMNLTYWYAFGVPMCPCTLKVRYAVALTAS